MAWIGLCDRDGGRFAAGGLGLSAGAAYAPGPLMTCGTVMIEALLSPEGGPQDLFGFAFRRPWARRFMIRALPCGEIALEHGQGTEMRRAALRISAAWRRAPVRITYAWDCARGFARLAVEQSDVDHIVEVAQPMPLELADLRALMLLRPGHVMAACTEFGAISTEIEPVGPSPTLDPDVPVATPRGYVAAGRLQRGDTVLTDGAGVVPVLHRVDRLVPARGSFRPLRLHAPYFGLRQDIVVAPDQRLVVRGADVEYLFGREAVLAPARHLLNGHVGRAATCGPVARYTQLILPGHETVLTAGCWSESLYIGRLRRATGVLQASILAGLDRGSLPEHGRPAFSVLGRVETVTLADQRAA